MRYRQGWKALNRLLHEDRSFSGHERNCVFLNTRGHRDGSERFADISAVSGFDFDDDGRAIALTDWDFDGDLDVWVTNRTAPRVRLLKNNSPQGNHFLAIKLQGDGDRTNRDAIGARVKVVLKDDARPMMKTLSAGDAFLSQSSSWLHFGLGPQSSVQHVTVHWPGGQVVQYDDIEIDRRYVINQRNGSVTTWHPPSERKELVAASQNQPTPGEFSRTVLPAPRLLPTLRTDGSDGPLNSGIDQPTIISIWSSTCNACCLELSEFAQHADELRKAGLNVVAINLDNLESPSRDGATKSGAQLGAKEVLKRIEFPFTAESGTVELVRSLDVLKRSIFDRWQTLKVPSSFLVDANGFVRVVYEGSVSVQQLVGDVKLLTLPVNRLREFSTPFAGRWSMAPSAADPLQVSSRFIDEAMIQAGIDYLERHAQFAEQNQDASQTIQSPSDLYYVLAVLLRDQNQVDEAALAFQKAIQLRPDDVRFRGGFANLLAGDGRLSEAAEQLDKVLEINPRDVGTERKLAFIRMTEGNFSAAINRFNNILRQQPKDVACWYNLANAYRKNGDMAKAIETYRQTLKVQPQMLLAANNLAWILATNPTTELRDGIQSVELAEQICVRTKHTQPSFLDTLACAYAENGDFDKAISTAEKAIELFTKSGQSERASAIASRLKRFKQEQPHRDSNE